MPPTSRPPIALGWPVTPNGPMPGRPIRPVARWQLMIALTLSVPEVDWLTPWENTVTAFWVPIQRAVKRASCCAVRPVAVGSSARVDGDDFQGRIGGFGCRDPLEQDRVAPCQIGASQHDQVGLIEDFIGAPHGIGAKGPAVPATVEAMQSLELVSILAEMKKPFISLLAI